jgi:hypothetical protein
LFPGPRPPRQVADLSVGKFVGFLATPHQAETRISLGSHSTTQLAALQVVRTTWPPPETIAGPAGPGGPGGPSRPAGPAGPCSPGAPAGPAGPALPFGPCVGCPHAPKVSVKTLITAQPQILLIRYSARNAALASSREATCPKLLRPVSWNETGAWFEDRL